MPGVNNIEQIVFKSGEPLDARKLKLLARASAMNRPGRGHGVRIRQLPWGYIPSYAATSTFTPPIWRVTQRGTADKLRLAIARGLVNGVEPVIGDVPIGGLQDAAGKTLKPAPELEVGADAYDSALGHGLLYLRVHLRSDWSLEKIEPVVLAKKPVPEPWRAYKLLGFLLVRGKAVRYQQMAYHNLGLSTLFDRRPSGIARYVWYAM